MLVETKKLLDFLEADGNAFTIPLFQRPYSWGPWQCETLWNDVERAGKNGRPHFFGAVFFRRERDADGKPAISLVDGQQRTLTSLLLLAALAQTRRAAGEGGFSDAVEKKYLHAADGREKAHPSKRDEESFRRALSAAWAEGADDAPAAELSRRKEDNANSNKRWFAKAAAAEGFDAQSFWRGLESFEIVSVELEEADDAQAVFESFNSKGVPLVAADMVRNYFLLAESPERQERLYLDYWEPMQGLFGDDPGSLRMNNALRAWTLIRCKTPKAKSDAECFGDFRRYFANEYDGDSEALAAELLSFCKVWAENYRYHAVKKYRSSNWAKIGRKTLVSGRPRKEASQEALDFYSKHYGIEFSEVRP